MARVFIDVNLFSAAWFEPVLSELSRAKAVRFAYSEQKQMIAEHEKVRKALTFYKTMGERKQRDDVPGDTCQKRIKELEAHPNWIKNKASCNDSHIFSLVYELPTPYVFSADTKIAACRGCMQNVVSNKYCDFIIISKQDTYNEHRQKILK